MEANELTLTCDGCGKIYKLAKTPELPKHVFFMHCNFCPVCEDTADNYYNEWWDENENKEPSQQEPDDPNQLVMPFIIDDIVMPVKELEFK